VLRQKPHEDIISIVSVTRKWELNFRAPAVQVICLA
jgi:hypothetical protein